MFFRYKYFAFLAFFVSLHASGVTDLKVIKEKGQIISVLEKIPAYGGFLDAAIYNRGESVSSIWLSAADKGDVSSDPINIKRGDRFIDIHLNDSKFKGECDYAGSASFTIRRGKYIPTNAAANWFQNHICKAPD